MVLKCRSKQCEPLQILVSWGRSLVSSVSTLKNFDSYSRYSDWKETRFLCSIVWHPWPHLFWGLEICCSFIIIIILFLLLPMYHNLYLINVHCTCSYMKEPTRKHIRSYHQFLKDIVSGDKWWERICAGRREKIQGKREKNKKKDVGQRRLHTQNKLVLAH